MDVSKYDVGGRLIGAAYSGRSAAWSRLISQNVGVGRPLLSARLPRLLSLTSPRHQHSIVVRVFAGAAGRAAR